MTDENANLHVVVGAGIVGAAIGLELVRRGHQVLLLDRDQPGMGTSFGNMACIAVTGFPAASRPATWKKIPGWMLNPLGPVALRPAYALKAASWFLRFIAAGSPARVRQIDTAMAGLSKRTLTDLDRMLDAAGAKDLLTEEGCLSLYETEAEFAADSEALGLMSSYGFAHSVLSGREAHDLEPALSSHIAKAVLLPDNRTIRNPYELVVRLVKAMVARGGRFENGEVTALSTAPSGQKVLTLSDGRTITAKSVILAMGVRTRDLAKALGEPVPLETERGYHTQIMAPGVSMRYSLIWPHRAFMVTPTAGGIRIGGSVEIAGLDAEPNYKRADVLVGHAKRVVPGLKVQETTQWMGHRPSFPDTLPMVSPSSTMPGVWYATGHGHLGLTYSATTAMLMTDMIEGKAAPEAAALSITRYRKA